FVLIGSPLSSLSPLSLHDALPICSLFKRDLRYLNVCSAGMNMQGSLAISSDTYVDLDPERKDHNGVPLPRVHLRYGPNDNAMARSEEHTSELQSPYELGCRLPLEK